MERAKFTIEETKKYMKNIEKGDKVRIIKGDMRGLVGVVIETDDRKVKISCDHDFIPTEGMDFMPDEVEKMFEVGDHVEILNGKHKGLTGDVIKVVDNVCHIISEDKTEEMLVMTSDVKCSMNVVVKQKKNMSIQDKEKSNNELNKHDLVILNDNKTVGVIISVLKHDIVIYDTEGYTR